MKQNVEKYCIKTEKKKSDAIYVGPRSKSNLDFQT